jgi:endoglucanase
LRFFMGEFGTGNSNACLADLHVLLKALQNNRLWLGWSYWAAGARWGPYPFSIQPGPNAEALQLTVLREYLPVTTARRPSQ